jgi:hypothetical protein
MIRAIAARMPIAPHPAVEIARALIVSGCALALALAERALPF